MEKSIKDLKKLWEKEKRDYKYQEVGSGVQKFVKEVLKCKDIFNLKEGKLSTPNEKRENEFLEEKSKKGRRGDVIIFIDSDRVIPVEIEKFGNIQAGEDQLFNYQRDWDKKYGILTDGYEWWFYNTIFKVKTFKLDSIFDKTSEFLDYWKEYIQTEKYYLLFFKKVGQLKLFEEDNSVESNIENFFADMTTLIKSFKNKLNIKGYFENIEKTNSNKRATEITYAYIIQFILYKTLADNNFQNFREDFNERLKRVYKDLEDKNYSDIITVIKSISDLISKNIYRPFSEEQSFINKKLKDILIKPINQLEDVTPWLDIFILIKRYNFANIKNEIFGYVYENYLKDVYEEKKRGQYYTDPAIVNFMIEQIGFTPDKIKDRVEENPDSISLIDPACGSGTFLYSATRNIMEAIPNGSYESSDRIENLINENIFGLDIEEFPLYLAEMSIIMRLLPLIITEKYNNPIDKKIKVFKTNDSIAEFLDTAVLNTNVAQKIETTKSAKQQSLFKDELNLGYESYVRNEDDLKDMKRSLEDRPGISRYRFDYVIGNPPYVSYNECSQQGLLFFKLLQDPNNGQVKLNNVYGVDLHSIPNYRKKYAPKPNLYEFFISLGLSLLKNNAKLCYIIPQTFLVNNDSDVLRYHLSKFFTIEEIVTFRGKMFIKRGIKQDQQVITSSLIIVVTNKLPEDDHKVKIIHYKDPEDDVRTCLENIRNSKKTREIEILQKELLENLDSWNYIKKGDLFLRFLEEYKNNSKPFSLYYQHDLAYKTFKSKFIFDGSTNIPKKDVTNDVPENTTNYYLIPILKSDGSLISKYGYYPKDKDIKIAQGSQGLIVAEPKYKILWSYINFDGFYFSSKKDVLPIYQQYCITSDNEYEIYYLFSLLNSKLNLYNLEAQLKVEQEDKLKYLLGVSAIKKFIKVPIITDNNRHLKDEIVELTKDMLAVENRRLIDFVNFGNTMIQKFDDFYVSSNKLILEREEKQIKCNIIIEKDLVKRALSEYKELVGKKDYFSLTEIKSIPIIDFEKQKALKNHIDDLVFALYFNIFIEKDKLKYYKKIEGKCRGNIYYELIKREE